MGQRRAFQHVTQPHEPLRITLSIVPDVSVPGMPRYALCARADGAVDARLPTPLQSLPAAAAEARRICNELVARGYNVAFQCDFDVLVAA